MIENHKAIVVELTNVRPHSNADRLQLATVCGCQIIVGIAAKEGDLGVFFPEGVRLSEEFAEKNDLIRRKDADGNNAGGMFDKNCRVRCQNFRKEKSEGFWTDISSLHYVGVSCLPGDCFDTLNGKEICRKYVPKHNGSGTANKNKRNRGETPMFAKHFKTHQLRMNYDEITHNDHIILTLKVHGTSQRIGRVLEPRQGNWLQKWWWGLNGTENSWQYLVGTRNVICGNEGGNPFHTQSFRDRASAPFLDNLRKGEVIYYEVVGYEEEGKLIMPAVDTGELSKEDKKLYGKTVEYTYGCEPGELDIYVYRVTMVNEDGVSYDLSWQDVKTRCHELGVKHVVEIDNFIPKDRFDGMMPYDIDDMEHFKNLCEHYTEGRCLVSPNQPREGICVRVEGNPVKVFKNKGFVFKTLEGIGSYPTIEDES